MITPFESEILAQLQRLRSQLKRPHAIAAAGVVVAACSGMLLAAAVRPKFPEPRRQPVAQVVAEADRSGAPQGLSIVVAPPPQPSVAAQPGIVQGLQRAVATAPVDPSMRPQRVSAPGPDPRLSPPPSGVVDPPQIQTPPQPYFEARRRRAISNSDWGPQSIEAQIAAAEDDDPRQRSDDRRRAPPGSYERGLNDGGPDRGPDDGW